MKRLTIYDIKRMTSETESFFFTRKTLKWFGQTMKSFKVYKVDEENYFVVAPHYHRDMVVGRTEWNFNTATKKLTPKNF